MPHNPAMASFAPFSAQSGVISSASPLGPTWYMPTTPTCCGVKPTNQAERFSFDVPVLPAMGLPSSAAKLPEPDL